jgi:uncharacterized protein (DUF305 family)
MQGQHGADPKVHDVAQAIIWDQEYDILQMRAILARLPVPLGGAVSFPSRLR